MIIVEPRVGSTTMEAAGVVTLCATAGSHAHTTVNGCQQVVWSDVTPVCPAARDVYSEQQSEYRTVLIFAGQSAQFHDGCFKT